MHKLSAVILLICLLAATACGGQEAGDGGAVVYTVGRTKVTYGEAMFYVLGQRDILADTYGERIWDVEFDGEDFGDFLKDKIKSSIALTYAGAGLAASRGIALTQDEKTLAASAASYYYTGLPSAMTAGLKVTPETAENAFGAFRLAKKGREQILADAGIEVSRDEARVMVLAQIKIRIKDLEGDALAEKRAKMEEAEALLEAGKDFMTVASTYNEAGAVQLTAARPDLAPSEERVAFALSDGEVSPVSENAEWLFIYKCLSISDETLSAARRSQLLAEKQESYYTAALRAYLEESRASWNDAAWGQADVSSQDIRTKYNFYSVYDMFFPEV